MNLYHYAIYVPKNLNMPKGIIKLQYSYHAKQASMNDKYGGMILPTHLDTDKAKVIEVETDENNSVTKVVYRTALDKYRDICIVVIPQTGIVKTVWINDKNDSHRTLNRSRYARN